MISNGYKRQIVLDTETTGLEPEKGHRIIEIGCIELLDRQLTGNNFHKYVNPQRKIDEDSVIITGITNEFLHDKPIFSDILSEFLDFINGAEIIAHNANFDVGFINHEMRLASKKAKTLDYYVTVFDTLALARKKFPGQRNTLDAICKRYKSHRECCVVQEIFFVLRPMYQKLLHSNLVFWLFLMQAAFHGL